MLLLFEIPAVLTALQLFIYYIDFDWAYLNEFLFIVFSLGLIEAILSPYKQTHTKKGLTSDQKSFISYFPLLSLAMTCVLLACMYEASYIIIDNYSIYCDIRFDAILCMMLLTELILFFNGWTFSLTYTESGSLTVDDFGEDFDEDFEADSLAEESSPLSSVPENQSERNL